ncbi:hypothetical protein J8C02_07725 [Chloracidobacterium sp. MS 40/45]|uniref:hypothetical protein n=1 Tax=Chloracidobacterium aggregatum TaxID=2851959 RepID=UPI001B8BC7E5|nr:hypothetical protein [Chloracidobacterium aggregatum]QUV99314.1 hypothetical protein J8C02_07725 [Chloracidobacterium sp. MS 40/45]
MWEIQQLLTLLFAITFLSFHYLPCKTTLWKKDASNVNLLPASGFLEKEELGNMHSEDRNKTDGNEAGNRKSPLIRKVDTSEYGLTYQPLQTETRVAPFEFKGSEIKPVANYAIRARVLKSEIDLISPLGIIAPVRLWVGWRQMGSACNCKNILFDEISREFHYSYIPGEIDPRDINNSISYMALVPADEGIGEVLLRLGKCDMVRMEGFLVNVRDREKGHEWKSSMSYADKSPKVLFVTRVGIEEAGK